MKNTVNIFRSLSQTQTSSILAGAFLGVWWVVVPVLTYGEGTSRDVVVEVVQEPFVEGDNLVYRWTGDIVAGCEIDLRRSIVDSESVVTNLTVRTMGALPRDQLGVSTFEIAVPVPIRIAEGKALYRVTEVPKCSWLQRLIPVSIPYPDVEFVVSR